jgi:hypothetical protein
MEKQLIMLALKPLKAPAMPSALTMRMTMLISCHFLRRRRTAALRPDLPAAFASSRS